MHGGASCITIGQTIEHLIHSGKIIFAGNRGGKSRGHKQLLGVHLAVVDDLLIILFIGIAHAGNVFRAVIAADRFLARILGTAVCPCTHDRRSVAAADEHLAEILLCLQEQRQDGFLFEYGLGQNLKDEIHRFFEILLQYRTGDGDHGIAGFPVAVYGKGIRRNAQRADHGAYFFL